MIKPISFTGVKQNSTTNPSQNAKNSDFLAGFNKYIKNSSDLNDTIQVPRTIFKGYLAFFTSTTLLTLGGFCKKSKKISTGFNIFSAVAALYGTYAFVRPYLLRQTPKDISKCNKN